MAARVAQPARTVILAPWRDNGEYRRQAWAMVRPYYEALGLPIFEADSGSEPFSTAQSYNRASEAAGPWDLAVLINTDCVVTYPQIEDGCRLADERQRVVIPHNQTFLLKRGYLVKPAALDPRLARLHTVDEARRRSPAGVIIWPRVEWDRVGGYDERFVRWGFEDMAVLKALGHFVRTPGPLYHYWHPQAKDGRTDFATKAYWRERYWGLPRPVEELVEPPRS